MAKVNFELSAKGIVAYDAMLAQVTDVLDEMPEPLFEEFLELLFGDRKEASAVMHDRPEIAALFFLLATIGFEQVRAAAQRKHEAQL